MDNFNTICDIIDSRGVDDDLFYFVQVIIRKKDNPDSDKSVRVIKTYYVNDSSYLLSKKDEIVEMCEKYNARAYINLNQRSYKKVALAMLKDVADAIYNEEYKSVKHLYDSCCGRTCGTKDKMWLVDIDFPCKYNVCDIVDYIENAMPHTNEDKICFSIPSKNGLHVFTRPFDRSKFGEVFPGIDIHKDNPTILYCKD